MISHSGRHALKAMVRLAGLRPGAFAGAAALAERTGAPANYLGKLLKTLAGAGVLESRKGPGGGFRLARPPERITLLEIVGPLSDLGSWSGCLLGQAECSDEAACGVHRRWQEMRDRGMHFLSETRLVDLLEAREGPAPTGGPATSRPEHGDPPPPSRSEP